jgi:hypothetical protein
VIEANRQAAWKDPIIDAGCEGCAGTAALGSGSSLELRVLLKTVVVRNSSGSDSREKKLYENRLAEFKQNCAESGLGRMYR